MNRIGDYEIVRELGRGGMGVVYLARDARPNRSIALKVLPPELTFDGRFVERFLREGRLAGFLAHSNVVSVDEAGEADGHHFLAMEYVEGTDLAKMLRARGRLEFALALEILEQVASGLDAAHAKGIVHRDIKPENILLDRSGQVKVADFGIARAHNDAGGTRTGTVIGTAEYISPEQALGKPVGAASDVYSLACVAYEMLTGAPPFGRVSDERTALSSINDRAHHQAPEISALKVRVTKGASWAITRALDKSPVNRPASASDLIAHIRHGVAPPISRRRVLGAASTVTLALAGGVAAWRIVGARGRRASEPPTAMSPRTWYLLQRGAGWNVAKAPEQPGKPLVSKATRLTWNEERALFLVEADAGFFLVDPAKPNQKLVVPAPKVGWIKDCHWYGKDTLVYLNGRVAGYDSTESELTYCGFDGRVAGVPPEAPVATGAGRQDLTLAVSPDHQWLDYFSWSSASGFELTASSEAAGTHPSRKLPAPRAGQLDAFSETSSLVAFSSTGKELVVGYVAETDIAANLSVYALPDLTLVKDFPLGFGDRPHYRVEPLWATDEEIYCKVHLWFDEKGEGAERKYRLSRREGRVTPTDAPPAARFQSRSISQPAQAITPQQF